MSRPFSSLFALGVLLASQPVLAQHPKASSPSHRTSTAKPKTVVAAQPVTGARLVETIARRPGELIIPYSKYVLPNGLTVIVTEDHSDPLVHVDVTYHVGSAREQIGKSGFAHFFEHMMFQGSDHVGDQQHFKLVTAAGGNLNGTTNQDRTNYYETLPSNQLETALWLEADRMGFLLDAVSQKKFEIQRSTVKNERGQNIDNRPYGQANEYMVKTLYPYGHPYSWSTIGYLKDLDNSNVNDLKNFFLRWYGPNNATLTVGGDVRTADVVKLAEKYFGPIHRGPAVLSQHLPAPVLTADRYVSYEDNIRFPLVELVFPAVPHNSPDELALDALAEIIGQGNNSLLYKNLVKPQLAVQASAYASGSELAGEFIVQALAVPGQHLDSTEARLRRTLVEFARTGASAAAVQRFKASREAGLVNNLASVSGKVSQLAANQTFTGNPNYLKIEQQRLQALTPADVRRVFDKYLRGKYAVVLSVVPKGKPELVAHTTTYTADPAGYQVPKDEYAGLRYVKAQDSFDRSQQPKSGPNPVVQVPALWEETFANGLKLVGTRNAEVPSVTLLLTIRGGHRLEQNDPAKAGLAALTAALLNEGTTQYTGEQLGAALDRLGSFIRVGASDENTTISVHSLTKNLPATLALLQEVLLHPRFDAADFDRLKKQTLEGLANQAIQPVTIANTTYSRLLYGSTNIMSVPVNGTPASVGSLTLDDVKAFYAANYAPNVASLVVVGDVAEADVLPQVGFLKTWARKDVVPSAAVAAAPQPGKTHVYFVNKEGAPQSEIRVGYLTSLRQKIIS
jgi:zinc protease